MKFAIVRPKEKTVRVEDYADVNEAAEAAGLKMGQVDFGAVVPGLSIVAFEFGLFSDPRTTSYFAINGQLFAGNCILFSYNEEGETIDLHFRPWLIKSFLWLENGDAVEQAIRAGTVIRPVNAINDQLLWSWSPTQTEQRR